MQFTQIEFHTSLTKWVVADDQPFTTFENQYFQHMIKVLNPDAVVPIANIIKKDIMECYKEEKKRRKDLFQVSF